MQATLQWLQDASQINSDKLKCFSHETTRFSGRKEEIFEDEIQLSLKEQRDENC